MHLRRREPFPPCGVGRHRVAGRRARHPLRHASAPWPWSRRVPRRGGVRPLLGTPPCGAPRTCTCRAPPRSVPAPGPHRGCLPPSRHSTVRVTQDLYISAAGEPHDRFSRPLGFHGHGVRGSSSPPFAATCNPRPAQPVPRVGRPATRFREERFPKVFGRPGTRLCRPPSSGIEPRLPDVGAVHYGPCRGFSPQHGTALSVATAEGSFPGRAQPPLFSREPATSSGRLARPPALGNRQWPADSLPRRCPYRAPGSPHSAACRAAGHRGWRTRGRGNDLAPISISRAAREASSLSSPRKRTKASAGRGSGTLYSFSIDPQNVGQCSCQVTMESFTRRTRARGKTWASAVPYASVGGNGRVR